MASIIEVTNHGEKVIEKRVSQKAAEWMLENLKRLEPDRKFEVREIGA